MSNLFLYSTNPWFSYEVCKKYRNSVFYVWCSEYFDPRKAPCYSSAALIAPSSSPISIYWNLHRDKENEDTHSTLIKEYRKKFRSLATEWFVDGEISEFERDEIIAGATSSSWKIWRPLLYIIDRQKVESSGRLASVPLSSRAAIGQEFQIFDLKEDEFEIMELMI